MRKQYVPHVQFQRAFPSLLGSGISEALTYMGRDGIRDVYTTLRKGVMTAKDLAFCWSEQCLHMLIWYIGYGFVVIPLL